MCLFGDYIIVKKPVASSTGALVEPTIVTFKKEEKH